MNFQEMYENIQNGIKEKVSQIESKRTEISVLEIEIYKMQGATEMLAVISKELEKQQNEEDVKSQEVVSEQPTISTTKKNKIIK